MNIPHPKKSDRGVGVSDLRVTQLILHRRQGGMETVAALLQEGLTQRGWKIRTVALDDNGNTRSSRIRTLRRGPTITGGRLILAHSAIPSAYARMFARRGTSVVSVLHSASDDWCSKKLRWIEQVTCGKSRAVVAVSQHKAAEYIRYFPNERRKVVVIPNGVDVPAPQEDLSRSGLLYAARINSQKNLLTLIRALAILAGAEKPLHLRVAGQIDDERYFSAVKSEINKASLDSYISFLGPRNDTHLLMQRAELLVHPSKAEAHSLTLLEAAMSSLPIVASSAVLGPTTHPQTVGLSFDAESPVDMARCIREAMQSLPKLQAEARTRSVGIRESGSVTAMIDAYDQTLRLALNLPYGQLHK